ncbi:hypothetical protein V1T76_10810 [Roseibium sp. FZY0029]|nr:hypothetical protein [Roseibium sp. FZY0029]
MMIFGLATVAFVVCIAVLIYLQKTAADKARDTKRTNGVPSDEI